MFDLEQYYDKKLRCPLCEMDYTSKKVLSRGLRVVRTEGDFYAEFAGPNPNHYLANVCRQCGYSFVDQLEPRKIQERLKMHYLEVVAMRWNQRDFTGLRA